MSATVVQVCGCKDEGQGSVKCFVSDQEAEFYGVYLGSPGSFKHYIDKDMKDDALSTAQELINKGEAAELDDKTFVQ